MYTSNLELCQETYENMQENEGSLNAYSKSSIDDAYQNVSKLKLAEVASIENYMAELEDGCALLTRILHAALQSSDVDKALRNQFAEFAFEMGVLS